MKTGIFIANTERRTGRSLVALGVMKLMLSKVSKVGYFRPIISDHPDGKHDNHIETMLSFFNLDIEYKDAYGFTMSQVLKYKNLGQEDRLIEKIIDQYKSIEKKYDVVLVEGTDFDKKNATIEFDLNVEIAKNLALPTILVSSARRKDLKEAVTNIELSIKSFAEKDVEVQAVFINRLCPELIQDMKEDLKSISSKNTAIEIIPEIEELGSPTVGEIVKEIDGKILLGENLLDRQVYRNSVGAMQLHNFLPRMTENVLVITPGDRSEIILGALQANVSTNYPAVAGIVLTGGIPVEDSVLKLIEGLPSIVPIILVETATYITAQKISNIKTKICPTFTRKIELSISTFEEYVDTEFLLNKFNNYKSNVVTPQMFQYSLVSKAKSNKKHIVLPEGTDTRILQAATSLMEQNVVDITLLGRKDEIFEAASKIGISLSENINIIDPATSEHYEDYWKTYYTLRSHKNIPEEMAQDAMADVSFFGTMMVYKGHADGMVSGAAHTTAHTIIPALQFIKTKPGVSTVSSCFFMCLDDHIKVMGDCAVNVSPDANQLAEIAISSADSAKAFGIDPKVALLSYSSGNSGSGKEVEKVKVATEKAIQMRPDLNIEGPIQYDAAVDPSVAKSKMPNSKVAGQANVLIFPDLNTGNNTYKAVQRETGALAIGPMLQGLNKPVNDLSRGCTVEDIFNTVVITAIQAQEGL